MFKKLNLLLLIFFCLFSFSRSELNNPPNGSELNYIHVKFEWDEVIGTLEYEFQLSNSQNFDLILKNINVSNIYHIEKYLINWESKYYWRVKPKQGDWIGINEFSTSKNSEIEQNDNKPIEIVIYNPDLALDGLTLYGSYYNNYSAAIDMDGNEVWNSGGLNTFVFFNMDANNNLFGGKFLTNHSSSLIGCELSMDGNFNWTEPLNEEILNNESFIQHEIVKLPNTLSPHI